MSILRLIRHFLSGNSCVPFTRFIRGFGNLCNSDRVGDSRLDQLILHFFIGNLGLGELVGKTVTSVEVYETSSFNLIIMPN